MFKDIIVEWTEEDDKLVKEYVYYSLIWDRLFILTTPSRHEVGELIVGVLYLGEL